VLTVVDALEVGGVTSHLTSSLGRISRARYDLRVANLGTPTPLSDRLRDLKLLVYDLGITGLAALPRRVFELRRLIRHFEIDLVHSYGHAGPAARLAARGVPVVSTLPEPNGADRGPGARLRAWLERKTAARTARLLVPSEAMRRHYVDDWGVPVEILPNFMDVPAFGARVAAIPRSQARTRFGVGPDEIMLLHMGRGGAGKGLVTLLEAFRVARIEHPPLRLFLTGQGSGVAHARAQAEALRLGDAVVFLGVVDDVAPLYAAADLFLLPSHREGWSMALLEAMAAGLPTVATTAGVIPELASTATAILVETDRAEALAGAILKLVRAPRVRATLGAEAAARAHELDVGVWAPRLEALYDDVIKGAQTT
jgi:glycosyltransferase involved in cell wall biosynthesis